MSYEDALNLVLGLFSILGLISGFIIEEYRIYFWIISVLLLIFVVIGYYVSDNRIKIFDLNKRLKKLEESLNIMERLNKLEMEMKMKKRGQSINLIDIIKIGLAILLIIVFVKAILSII